nr:nucleotide-binding alpha-beta plait domain-containing protein [Tanacetum cinerariifolium]
MVYHTYSKEFRKKIEYSKVKILKVLSLEEWSNKPHTNKVLAGYLEYAAYNYYDYQEAWYKTFLLRNHNHSWFLHFAEEFLNKYPKWFTKWFKYMGSIPEIFPSIILEGYNKYNLMFAQESAPPFEYTLQFTIIFRIPWILSFKYKKQDAEGISPPLLLRKLSVKWWKQVDEGQANIKAVSEYYNSLIKNSPSVSTSKTSITDADAIERFHAACSSKKEIQKILNEVRRDDQFRQEIAITLKPKLPSPSSPLISQNKFIPLFPYSSPYSPRPRPTYSALANLTKEYYETVLHEGQSIMVYDTYSKEFPKKIEYSKVKILKVLSLEELGNKPHTNKVLAGYPESKEDDVNCILILIFVMNFPESFFAKDLFHTCKQYGHVVDSFIPSKRTKEGKQFGFVRFINVFNVDRLVNNLCTIWVGRLKLHANTARFQRKPLNEMSTSAKTVGENNRGGDKSSRSFGGVMGNGNSYINVLKSSNGVGRLESHSPYIVLDDECVISKELSYSLMGRVKEFALLTNLKTTLLNEGFADLSVRYLGELWVLLEFSSSKTKEPFRVNVGASSWFSEIRQASLDIIPDGHIVFWIRAKEVPGWVPDLIEESEEEEQSDVGSLEGDNKINEDDLCRDNMDMADVPETNDKDHSPKYPLGFTPNEETNVNSGIGDKFVNYNEDKGTIRGDGVFVNVNSKGDDVDSKAKKDWVKELCFNYKVNFLAIQETKMEEIDIFSVRSCWGNSIFEHLHSNSVGNSGGILCVWDPNAFRKYNHTISDYFVIIRGVWLKNGIDLTIIAVYAPHDPRDKFMLWEYLGHVVNQWHGEVVIMGDFNEVR